ncbi:hypothetical protein TRVL_01585 [Trypanosoma vivax]|uniref:Uncharacterized protein n=1 Tax=Trypanosoma vivax (strain Y486) TaxID=1055687 RepID=G0U1B0_TRYVY|nr:hypothetical protein TRVL_01585 [Trypanosoma vivax]CCC49865.1 hypothetical protein TVY486_0804730 [Trypanosoma vivax Y486]
MAPPTSSSVSFRVITKVVVDIKATASCSNVVYCCLEGLCMLTASSTFPTTGLSATAWRHVGKKGRILTFETSNWPRSSLPVRISLIDTSQWPHLIGSPLQPHLHVTPALTHFYFLFILPLKSPDYLPRNKRGQLRAKIVVEEASRVISFCCAAIGEESGIGCSECCGQPISHPSALAVGKVGRWVIECRRSITEVRQNISAYQVPGGGGFRLKKVHKEFVPKGVLV